MDEKASYFAKYLGDLFRFNILNRIDKYKSEAFLSYTANVYSAYGVSAGFPCCGETLQYLQIAGKSYSYNKISPQFVNITGFIHNLHWVSLGFLQLFSIISAGFPCPRPRSFYGVKICIVEYFRIVGYTSKVP